MKVTLLEKVLKNFIEIVHSDDENKLRIGQKLMCALNSVDSNLYDTITKDNPEADCFYNDYNINNFFLAILGTEE